MNFTYYALQQLDELNDNKRNEAIDWMDLALECIEADAMMLPHGTIDDNEFLKIREEIMKRKKKLPEKEKTQILLSKATNIEENKYAVQLQIDDEKFLLHVKNETHQRVLYTVLVTASDYVQQIEDI